MGPKKIKVLYVIPGPKEGPSMIFAKRQVDSLAREGVIACRFFLLSRTSPRKVFAEWLRLSREIKAFGPDIIHAQYGTATSFLCGLFFGPRIVITLRGSDINFVKGMNPLRALMGKVLSHLSVLRADAVMCVSGNLKSRLWWGKGKTTVIPSGVNMELFRPVPGEEARRRLGLSASTSFILFNSGGYKALKRMDIAEKAVSILRRTRPGAELLVLDGTADADDVHLYHNAADCLLVTSDKEGSPNIVKEALACNLPVVSVDVGDVRERLEGVFPSKIVSRDPEAIADAVSAILASKERSNGREKVIGLSEGEIAKAIVRLYEKILY